MKSMICDFYYRGPCPANMSTFARWENPSSNQLCCWWMGQDKGKYVVFSFPPNILKPDWSVSSTVIHCIVYLLCCSIGGRLPLVLREVRLDLVDPAKCKYVLQTVKSSALNQGPDRPQPAMTVLCAGPESGGKDACQVEREICTIYLIFHNAALHLVQELLKAVTLHLYMATINLSLYPINICFLRVILHPLSRGTQEVLWYVRQSQAEVTGWR